MTMPAPPRPPDAHGAPERALPPRVVVVSRPSERDELLARHGTLQQARFFLESRGQRIDEVLARHELLHSALHAVAAAVPLKWRRARVERHELDRFLFEADDVVVAVGQDGLVANVAKYLRGQPVVGVNPSPALYDGVLVRHPPQAVGDLLAMFARGRLRCEARTMVQARLGDGQTLLALNEIFVGHVSHQSARYRIRFGERGERHSSSGLIVATGTGASGWARSIVRARAGAPPLPGPLDAELAFMVREAWPSVATGASLVDGSIGAGERLVVTSEMNEGGTLFGDGIEVDRIDLAYGQTVALECATERMQLVT
jgi:NAD kinase